MIGLPARVENRLCAGIVSLNFNPHISLKGGFGETRPMKISKKQQKTLEIAHYFSRKVKATSQNLGYYGLSECKQSPKGISAEEAFLATTDRGLKKLIVKNLSKYLSLLIGHNNAAIHMKMWSEGFRERTLLMNDFDDEPQVIKELAKKALEASRSSRYDYVQPLDFFVRPHP